MFSNNITAYEALTISKENKIKIKKCKGGMMEKQKKRWEGNTSKCFYRLWLGDEIEDDSVFFFVHLTVSKFTIMIIYQFHNRISINSENVKRRVIVHFVKITTCSSWSFGTDCSTWDLWTNGTWKLEIQILRLAWLLHQNPNFIKILS